MKGHLQDFGLFLCDLEVWIFISISCSDGRKRPREDSMSKVNIAEKFAKITEYWKPYIAAELNGQYVKLDKLKGE